MAKKNIIILFTLFVALALIAITSLTLGRYSAPLSEQLSVLFRIATPETESDKQELLEHLLFSTRLPRICAALVVGIALAMAGTTYQTMFRNPLVSPELLGVMAGAILGIMVGIVSYSNPFVIQLMAFAGGLFAVGLTLLISSIYKSGDRLLILVLAGIICSAMLSSIGFLITSGIDPEEFFIKLEYWLDGGLGLADGRKLLYTMPLFITGVIGMFVCNKALNILSLGEEAATLGVNPIYWRIAAICSATLVSAITVTLAGMVAWIGLVAPHFARLLVKSDSRTMLPISGLIGAGVLLVADDCSRTMFSSTLPMSLCISVLGIPIFMILLYRSKNGVINV